MGKSSTLLSFIIFICCICAIAQSPPDNRRVDLMRRYRTALYFEQMGQIDRAIEIYRYLYNQAPGNFAFFKKYIDLLIQSKAYDEAQNVILKQINRYPENRNLQIELGKLYALKGDTLKAIEIFNDFIESQRYSKYSVSRVFNLLISIGMFDLAEEVVFKARERLGNPVYFAIELGNYFKMRKFYKRALTEYLELLKRNPESKNVVERYISTFPVDRGSVQSFDKILIDYKQSISENIIDGIRSQLYFNAGIYDSCFSIVKELDRNMGTKGQKLLELAEKLYKNEHYNWSKRIYKFLLNDEQYSSLNISALIGLANSYYQSLVSADNFSILDYFYNGNRFFAIDFVYYDTVDVEGMHIARSLYSSIIDKVKIGEERAEAIYRIGCMEYGIRKDFDSALRFFKQAFDYYVGLEKKAQVLDDIIDVNVSKGNIDIAERECYKWCKLFEGTDIELLMKMKLVQVWFLAGKIDSCYKYKSELLALASGDDENLNDIVEFYQFFDRYFNNWNKKGNTALTKFIEAERLMRMDRLSEALAVFELIVSDFPDEKITIVSRFRLAQIYLIFGDEGKAIDNISEIITSAGLLPQLSVLMIGDYFYFHKDYENSKKWYLFFINNYPESVFIGKVRDRYRSIQKVS